MFNTLVQSGDSSRRLFVLALAIPLLCGFGVANAQQESPAHDELRELRARIFAAYEARNMDDVLALVHPDVIATWQNGFRARGHAEVRKFYDEMMKGENRIVRDVKSKLTVDGLSVLHGETTAVACGNLSDNFDLTSGSKFELDSKWTATLVKQDNKWVVASFHVSSNIFENPILAAVKSWMTTLVAVAAIVALIVGGLIGFLMARRRLKATPNAHAA